MFHSKFTLLIFAFFPVCCLLAQPQVVEFTTVGSNNWTAPAGVTSVTVEAWGGGGGGGGFGNSRGGGGAGGGAYVKKTVSVNPFTSYVIVVGAGGSGYTGNTGSTSAAGKSSSFNSTAVVAGGGCGGINGGGGGTGGGGGCRAGSCSSADCSSDAELMDDGSDGLVGQNSGFDPGGNGGDAGGIGGGLGGLGRTSNGDTGTAPGGGGGGAGFSTFYNGGKGAPGKVRIIYNDGGCSPPAAPTGNSFYQFCSADSPTISNLSANGSSIKWYDDGGNLLNSSTLLVDGGAYYASQTVGNCESSDLHEVNVTIDMTPGAPFGDSVQSFCTADIPTIADLTSNGYNLKWYDAPINGNLLNPSNALIDGKKYFGSDDFGGNCYSVERLEVTVIVKRSPNTNITGNTSGCSSVTLTASGGDTYSWSGGASASAATNTFSASGTYTVTVTSPNSCSASASVSVTVNDKPAITLGAAPSVIQGATTADLPYTVTAGNPDQYRLDWDATALAQGFANQNYTSLPASPIVITVPSAAIPGIYNAGVTVRNSTSSCLSDSLPFTVTISVATGLHGAESNSGKSYLLFINPVQDNILVLQSSDNLQGLPLTLHNALGQLAMSQIINNSRMQIDVSALPAGVYLLQAGEVAKKLVISGQ